MTRAQAMALFVPSIEALMAWVGGRSRKMDVPPGCENAFARSWFDASFFTYIFGELELDLPPTCTPETYAAGKGCLLQVVEPVSKTKVQVRSRGQAEASGKLSHRACAALVPLGRVRQVSVQ